MVYVYVIPNPSLDTNEHKERTLGFKRSSLPYCEPFVDDQFAEKDV